MAIKSLEDLKAAAEASQTKGTGGRYLKIDENSSVKVWFLQELTEDADNYDESAGTAATVHVVQSPHDFTKQAQATQFMDKFNYKSWTQEQEDKEKGWKPKLHLLVNVAVLEKNDDGDEVWVPRVLDQKFSSQHIGNNLLEIAGEFGSITDRPFKISRKGGGKETQYSIIPLGEADRPFADDEFDLHDLDTHYPVVAPDDQKAFYAGELEKGDDTKGW